MKKIAVAANKDCRLYGDICNYLLEQKIDLFQPECSSNNRAEDIAQAAALVSEGKVDGAIVISSTGLDAAIIGNKFPDVRSSLVSTKTTAMYTREHNDSNLLCIGDEIIGPLKVMDIIGEWLTHHFIGGRHAISVGMIGEIEKHSCCPNQKRMILPAVRPIRHISIGNDHAGYEAKLAVLEILKNNKISYTDYGTDSTEIVRYPYYAARVDRDVLTGKADGGILICGTGIGINIAGNKYKGIRATLCNDKTTARIAREEFDANVLCLGGKIIGLFEMTEIVEEWIYTRYTEHESDFFKVLADTEAKNMCSTDWVPENNV